MSEDLESAVEELLKRADDNQPIAVSDCDSFLNDITRFTAKHGMEETKKFLTFLGNPDENMKIIHVAGTDGKGSTVNFLCDLLMSQGYKVGTLTSPHNYTHLDRIRINNQNITDQAFLNILNQNYEFFNENNL